MGFVYSIAENWWQVCIYCPRWCFSSKGIDEFGGNAVGMLYVQVEKIIFTGKENIQWDVVEIYLGKVLDRLL